MNGFMSRIARFFSGRYGIDSLGYFTLGVYALLCIFNAIFRTPVLHILTLAVLVVAVWRMMSKNYVRRLAENRRFTAIWGRVRIFFKLQFDRVRYIRSDRFRRCRHCRAIIKLPASRGKHTVKCPKCGEKFDIRLL